MDYEWDIAKYRKNIKKHKVTFEQAILAIEDPCSLFSFDDRHSEKEDRYIVIGSAEGLVLFVNEIEIDENTIRIISARLAKTHEKEAYYENCSLFFGKRAQTH
jgi:uncharacterized DUF497 family protein